jgi:hypothetical protein
MDQSPTIGAIGAALAKAQAHYGDYRKDHEAKIKSSKGDFSYAYATLADAYEAIREPLSVNEIAIVQQVRTEPGLVMVRTMLVHSSGEWIASELRGGADTADMRPLGSSITYLRRYSLLGLVGLAADDDDAETAKKPPAKRPEPKADAATKGKPAGKVETMPDGHKALVKLWTDDERASWEESIAKFPEHVTAVVIDDWQQSKDKPLPSAMTPETRAQFLAYLQSAKGLDTITAYTKSLESK